MFCDKCGKEIKGGDKFCNSCGAAVGVSEKKNYWKYFGYVWIVIINLITIGVVLGIYSNLHESFEVIVVSLLILIYLSIQTFAMTYGKITAETTFALDGEFKRIRRLLKDEPDEYETDEIQEVKKKVDKATVKMYINSSFMFIIYLVALLHILDIL